MRGINRCEGRYILAVVARVVISHVPSIHGIGGLLVVVVKLLNVEGVASCVVYQLSSRTWFKRSILGSGPSLGVEVFSQVIYGRLELVYCTWTAWGSFVVFKRFEKGGKFFKPTYFFLKTFFFTH